MKGDGDSEIALVVEDEDVVDSTMDGEPFQVARFATTLRRQLFKEHLGLIPATGLLRAQRTSDIVHALRSCAK
jgi:hypothetical protein